MNCHIYSSTKNMDTTNAIRLLDQLIRDIMSFYILIWSSFNEKNTHTHTHYEPLIGVHPLCENRLQNKKYWTIEKKKVKNDLLSNIFSPVVCACIKTSTFFFKQFQQIQTHLCTHRLVIISCFRCYFVAAVVVVDVCFSISNK